MKRLSSLFSRSTPTTPFQILSDLHLEHSDQYATFDLPISAPNLILAGDIGRLADYDAYLGFLVRRTTLFERVFLVLGATEFHGLSFNAGIAAAKRLEAEPALKGKLILLHQQKYDLPGTNLSVLGCTLWSRIPESAAAAVVARVPDFRNIEHWSVEAQNAAHADDVSWLKSQVSANRRFAGEIALDGRPERSLLVVTHHAPAMRECNAPWAVDSPWCSAGATDLLAGWDWTGVRTWVFGCTHWTTDFVVFGVRAVSNQRGVQEGGELAGEEKKKKKAATVFDVRRVIQAG
ncbi:Ser/Thr protein phosphatase [Lophium mytilinum]|uniref:Ser/Thr protein phosphatase n=1 Tax=Lophium mytilinum TaxID=390894 RepID=A0A6A6QAP4_9PEZI|nr:Ser/Thr protein phosphatase [Lophium mytilinum]